MSGSPTRAIGPAPAGLFSQPALPAIMAAQPDSGKRQVAKLTRKQAPDRKTLAPIGGVEWSVLMPTYPPRRKLPTAYSTEIGRIISRWAYVEWRLKSIVYLLLKVNPKQGRVVVPQASAVQAFHLIQQLLPLRNIDLPPNKLKAIKKKLERTEEFRNAIAHGVWLTVDETDLPVLQITRRLRLFSRVDTARAKVNPQALPLKLEILRQVVKEIDGTARFCDWLFDKVRHALVFAQGPSSLDG